VGTAGFNLVLASRSDPPIGLPRLRVEGRLRELRGEDLAFTPEETTTYLAGQGLDLTERGRPHPAAADRGVGRRDPDRGARPRRERRPAALIERFGGDDHAVADYLVSEVLANLGEDERRFLLRTSVCTTLPVDLARELSGREDAGAVLDALVRDHVFTRRQGRTRDVYRYHELLRTYLLAELRRVDRGTERELQRVAGAWHARTVSPCRRSSTSSSAPLDASTSWSARRASVRSSTGTPGRGAPARPDRARPERPGEPRWSAPPPRSSSATSTPPTDGCSVLDRRRSIAAGDPALPALAATVGVWRARLSDRVEDALARLEASTAWRPAWRSTTSSPSTSAGSAGSTWAATTRPPTTSTAPHAWRG
jgi:hypothetical protein